MAKYQITAKTHNRITTYGIKYSDHIFIDDITTDKEELNKLTAKINRYKLSPCHLEQIVEDFLIDLSAD